MKRIVVGAHYGTGSWLAQRITAVVMVVYTAVILSVVASLPRMDYWQWKVLWQTPVVRYATVLVLQGLAFLLILASETLYGRFPIFKPRISNFKVA